MDLEHPSSPLGIQRDGQVPYILSIMKVLNLHMNSIQELLRQTKDTSPGPEEIDTLIKTIEKMEPLIMGLLYEVPNRLKRLQSEDEARFKVSHTEYQAKLIETLHLFILMKHSIYKSLEEGPIDSFSLHGANSYFQKIIQLVKASHGRFG
jgi:hypothetical protein